MIYEFVGPTAAPFDRTPSLRAFPARYIVVLDFPRSHPVLFYKAKRPVRRSNTSTFSLTRKNEHFLYAQKNIILL